MAEWTTHPLVLVAGGSLLTAAIFYRSGLAVSRRQAEAAGDGRKPKDLSDVLMALGNAILAGGAIALATFLIQQQVIQQRDRETRLLMTADLSGYDPGPAVGERGRSSRARPTVPRTSRSSRSGRAAGSSRAGT